MKAVFQIKKYPSAVDKWLLAILVAPPTALIVAGVCAMITKDARAGALVIIIGLFTGVLTRVFAFPCVYTLEEERLLIRCGIVKYDVPISVIVRVEKSGSLWSAPALSLRRVKIETKTGGYLVSPRDRDAFITDVRERMRVARRHEIV